MNHYVQAFVFVFALALVWSAGLFAVFLVKDQGYQEGLVKASRFICKDSNLAEQCEQKTFNALVEFQP